MGSVGRCVDHLDPHPGRSAIPRSIRVCSGDGSPEHCYGPWRRWLAELEAATAGITQHATEETNSVVHGSWCREVWRRVRVGRIDHLPRAHAAVGDGLTKLTLAP